MTQFEAWPPPGWSEVIVPWNILLQLKDQTPNELYDWCDAQESTGRYHVHGWRATEGFAFRFELAHDATIFRLRWSNLCL